MCYWTLQQFLLFIHWTSIFHGSGKYHFAVKWMKLKHLINLRLICGSFLFKLVCFEMATIICMNLVSHESHTCDSWECVSAIPLIPHYSHTFQLRSAIETLINLWHFFRVLFRCFHSFTIHIGHLQNII